MSPGGILRKRVSDKELLSHIASTISRPDPRMGATVTNVYNLEFLHHLFLSLKGSVIFFGRGSPNILGGVLRFLERKTGKSWNIWWPKLRESQNEHWWCNLFKTDFSTILACVVGKVAGVIKFLLLKWGGGHYFIDGNSSQIWDLPPKKMNP